MSPDPDDAPRDTPNFRGTALRGAAATGLAQAIRVATQIGSTILLARLLAPADFGVVAMVAPIVAFVVLFQDLGLQQAMIQAPEISADQINRMFWLNVGISGAIAVILCALGPIAAWFYGDMRVSLLTIAYAVPLLVDATAAQHMALLNRGLRFPAIALIDTAAAIVTLAASVAAAWLLQSYWALYVGSLAGVVVTAGLAWRATGWKPMSPRRRARTGHLIRFGLDVAGFNLLNFLSRNLDNVIVAKFFGAATLGLYDRSYKLLLAPLQNVNAPVSRIVLPILGRLRDEPARYRAAFMQVTFLVSMLCVPGLVALGTVADRFVPLVLGQRWAAAAPIFAWLALSGICQPLGNALGWLFISQQRTRELVRWGVISAVLTLLSFAAGVPWGAVGVAAGYSLGTIFVRMPWLILSAGRNGHVSVRDLLLLQLPLAVGAAIAFQCIRQANRLMPMDAGATTVLALILAYAVMTAAVLPFAQLRRMLLEPALWLAARRPRHLRSGAGEPAA